MCTEISWSREITQHRLDPRNRLVLLSAITAMRCGLIFLSLTLQSFPVFLCDRFVTHADRNKEYRYFKQFSFSCSCITEYQTPLLAPMVVMPGDRVSGAQHRAQLPQSRQAAPLACAAAGFRRFTLYVFHWRWRVDRTYVPSPI